MPSKRTKALAITPSVRQDVLARDGFKCIICKTTHNLTMAHYINRGRGGLGIEKNLVTLCLKDHFETDQTINRKKYLEFIKVYLITKYDNWNEKELYYGNRTD
jgi:5-methylcytosine-specific restriction endonuclease McrA